MYLSLYNLPFQAPEEIELGPELLKEPYVQKGKGTILMNSYKGYTRNLINMVCAKGRRTVLPILLSAHENKEQTHTGGFLRMDKSRVSNPFQPVPLPRKSPICCSYSNTSCEKAFCCLRSSEKKIPVWNPVCMTPLTGRGWAQRM